MKKSPSKGMRQAHSRNAAISRIRSSGAKDSAEICLRANVKQWICGQIFEGRFPDGALIPAERVLAGRLGVCRITIRAALEDMAREGFIERRHGSGTRVCLRTGSYRNSFDIITLMAPTANRFLGGFMNHFCPLAESRGALVLFKAAAAASPGTIEHYLCRLIDHNIRNMVIWLFDYIVDEDKIRRLRGLGCNLVFFDVVVDPGLADVVTLDNEHAVASLCGCARKRGETRPVYVGWDQMKLSSVMERENAFIKANPAGAVVRLSWQDRDRIDHAVRKGLKQFDPASIDNMICGDGRIGAGVGRLMRAEGRRQTVYCIDDHPQAETLGITTYAQPIKKMAETVYACLLEQAKGVSNWRGKNIKLKGKLIER